MKLIIATIITIACIILLSFKIGYNSYHPALETNKYDSLSVVCNQCLATLSEYEKEIEFKDSVFKELLTLVYGSAYMKGVIDYKLFKEYLDTVRKYEVDTNLIDN